MHPIKSIFTPRLSAFSFAEKQNNGTHNRQNKTAPYKTVERKRASAEHVCKEGRDLRQQPAQLGGERKRA